MNDLIIGMAANYTWDDLYPFVVSLRRSGYKGRCILINHEDQILDRVGLSPLPHYRSYGIEGHEEKLKNHPIVDRFRIIPELITGNERFVIACDTSDIVFQSDPMKWMEKHLYPQSLCVVSEGVTYEHSEGNRKNMIEAFGEEAYKWMRENEVINAGVIAGKPWAVKETCENIYEVCLKDRRSGVAGKTWDDMLPDQSALNLIVRPWWKIATAEDHFVYEYSHAPAAPHEFAIYHQYLCRDRERIREKYLE